ncbi:MAG: hypothetical protein QM751_10585 [Paludibacteraceae bacterium]
MFREFFDYLFYKYYHWQVRVGNGDIAPFGAVVFITFLTIIFIASIIGVFTLHIMPNTFPAFMTSKVWAIISMILIFSFYFFLFLYKKKYKKILKRKELKARSGLVAIILPIGVFLLFNMVWILEVIFH